MNILGTILLTHCLIFSAYLSHEFMHGTIFTNMRLNTIFGNIMLWINGGCYARFKDLAQQHICHHISKVDTVGVELSVFILLLPCPCLSAKSAYLISIAFCQMQKRPPHSASATEYTYNIL